MKSKVTILPGREESASQNTESVQKKRVGAYCRVSTKHDDQISSYYNQVAYYVDKIENNEDWLFVDIYADEGISGTKTAKRDEFNRMLEDCRNGLLDIVLVKSISRFARNTVDCLKYVRELRNLDVDVYFENENLHGMYISSEFLISIHAMHAQEQSVSISNNIRWSIRKQMRNGTWIPSIAKYGYRIHEDEIVKDKKVAYVIDMIKVLYINGYSFSKIRDVLNEKQIPSPSHHEKWTETTIIQILKDEMYQGHLIAQRIYTTETFPFERRINRGEMPKYIYYDDHEPYISKEETEKIIHILEMRRALNGSFTAHPRGGIRNCMSGNVYCAVCNGKMKRVHRGENKKIGYTCVNHIKNKEECSNKTVMETVIQQAFVKAFNKLKYYPNLLEDYLKDLKLLDRYKSQQENSKNTTEKIRSIRKQIYETAVMFNRSLCGSAFYVQRLKELREEIDKIQSNQKKRESELNVKDRILKTKAIQKLLHDSDYLMEFEEKSYEMIIDHVAAKDDGHITLYLKNGMILDEQAEVRK